MKPSLSLSARRKSLRQTSSLSVAIAITFSYCVLSFLLNSHGHCHHFFLSMFFLPFQIPLCFSLFDFCIHCSYYTVVAITIFYLLSLWMPMPSKVLFLCLLNSHGFLCRLCSPATLPLPNCCFFLNFFSLTFSLRSCYSQIPNQASPFLFFASFTVHSAATKKASM